MDRRYLVVTQKEEAQFLRSKKEQKQPQKIHLKIILVIASVVKKRSPLCIIARSSKCRLYTSFAK